MHYSTHLLRHLRHTIGQNIHQHRIQQKLTLRRLSRLTCIAEWRLDHYELGKNQIGLEQLLKIACVLEVDAVALLASA